jgi:hypothetical protein
MVRPAVAMRLHTPTISALPEVMVSRRADAVSLRREGQIKLDRATPAAPFCRR